MERWMQVLIIFSEFKIQSDPDVKKRLGLFDTIMLSNGIFNS